ncbi:MAG: ABC transporter permease [Rhodospirillales bacterium]|nr:ABC transporter permease [Rhodospirillales bacterium]
MSLAARLTRPAAGFALFLIAWQALALSGATSTDFFPTVPMAAHAFATLLVDSGFWMDAAASAVRLFAGLAIAVAAGIGLALLAALVPLIRRMLEPLVEILRVLPPPALVPLAIYALGLGPRMFLAIIVNAALWPVYVNAANALAATEPVQMLTGRALGYGPVALMWRLRLPAAAPEIFTGIRIAAAFALLATVAAEMLAGTDGLGYELYNAGFSLAVPRMFALMLAIGLAGFGIQGLVALARWRLVGWHAALAASGGRE